MTPAELMGVILIILALVLFLLEIKAPGFGLAGVCGVMTLIGGLILLFGFSWASLPFLIAGAIFLTSLFAFLALLARRALKNRVVTGEAGMIGLEGHAETALLPEGKVSVRGEIWDAWSTVRLERGEPIRVTGIRGLRLEVTAANERALARPVSAVPSQTDRNTQATE
ncbi:MAG: NfeD family protein [Acidobacteriota bacterium]